MSNTRIVVRSHQEQIVFRHLSTHCTENMADFSERHDRTPELLLVLKLVSTTIDKIVQVVSKATLLDGSEVPRSWRLRRKSWTWSFDGVRPNPRTSAPLEVGIRSNNNHIV